MNKKNKALKCLLGLMALPLLGCTAIDGIGTNSSPESLSSGGTAYESAGKSSVEETSSKQSEASSSRSEPSIADSSDSELSLESEASSLASEPEEPLSSESESASSEDEPLSSEGEDASSSLSSESEMSSEDQIFSSEGEILSSDGEAFSSEPPVESSIPSSEDILAKRKEVLDKFIENITPNNVTMELHNSKSEEVSSYYYLGKEAYVADGGTIDKGVLVNKDQGFFHFTLDGDALNLDYCEGLGNDITTYFVTPSGVFTDPSFYGFVELEGEGYSYSLDTEEMIFGLICCINQTPRSACLYYLLELLGSSGSDYEYVTSASLTIAPDASYADVEVKLTSGTTVITYTCHLYDFGKTDVKAVSDYLANPQDVPVPTGWNEDCAEAIGKVFAGKESDIIFPTGLISASFAQRVLFYRVESEDGVTYTNAGVKWTHYGDDLTESYGALLEENGYENTYIHVDESNGITDCYYWKEYKPQTEDEGAFYIECYWRYENSTQEFTCQFYISQDAMRYENLSLSDANAKIDEINATAEYDIPSLAESESIKSIDVADYTLVYGYTYYYAIDVFFENEDEAKAYAEAYIASISESYSDTGRYSWEDDGAVQYEVTNSSSYLAIFSLTEDEATDGTYFVEIIAAGV